MAFSKFLVWLTGLVFVIYGGLFVVAPETAAMNFTGSSPASTAGLVDMRATYGGLQLGFGLVLIMLVLQAHTLKAALSTVLLSMVAMACARTLGIVIDGDPGILIYIYLLLELVVAMLALLCLHKRLY